MEFLLICAGLGIAAIAMNTWQAQTKQKPPSITQQPTSQHVSHQPIMQQPTSQHVSRQSVISPTGPKATTYTQADALYANLLTKVLGDHATARRLIAYEARRKPAASQIECLENAIYHWERDNHCW